MNLYLLIKEKESGPYSVEQVKEFLAAGRVCGTDLAWHEGLPEWRMLASFPEFAQLSQPGKTVKKMSQRTLIVLILGGGLVFWGGAFFIFKKASPTSKPADQPLTSINSSANAIKTASFPAINMGSLPRTLRELNQWYAEPSEGKNGAPIILDALEQMRVDTQTKNSPLIPLLGKGKLPQPGQMFDKSTKDAMEVIVQQNAIVLGNLRQATKYSGCRYPMDLTVGFKVTMPHLAKIRTAAQLTAMAAVLQAHNRQSEEAGRMVLACMGITHSLEQEPVLISQVVRMRCVTMVASSLEQVLNHTALSAESLEELQTLFNKEEEQVSQGVGLTRAIVGERVMWLSFVDLLTESLKNPEEFKRILKSVMNEISLDEQSQIFERVKKHSREDRKFMEDAFMKYLATRSQPMPGRLELRDVIERTNEQMIRQRESLPISGMALTVLPGAVHKEAKQLAQLRLSSVAIALERYRLRNSGRYPDGLQALKPGFLAEVPLDPFTGTELKYSKIAQGYKIESSGLTDGSNALNEKDVSDLSFAVLSPQ